MEVYENYSLTRTISIREIVTADYITGILPGASVHTHPDAWELCCCLDGEAELVKDFHNIVLEKGNIALVQPDTPHDIVVRSKKTSTFVISFTCSGEQLRTLQDSIVTFDNKQLELFYQIIGELAEGFGQDGRSLHLMTFRPSPDSPFGAEHMICNYLEQIIITMLRNVTMTDGVIVRSGRFKDAMQSYLAQQVHTYILEHLGEKLSVDDIAARFHYSRARLSSIFKAASGMSINEVITFERMARAKALLCEGKQSISQIAESLGYCSPQYFSTRFTREAGCSPSQYAARQRH